MMRLSHLALVALAACQFDTSTTGSQVSGDAGQPLNDAEEGQDASAFDPDAAAAAIDCQDWVVQPTILDPCTDIEISEVDDALVLDQTGNEYQYDTDLGTLTAPNLDNVPHTNLILGTGGSAPRVVVARTIDLKSMVTLRATGTRPLILVSWGDITVSGTIDVGSDTELGAGGNASDCTVAMPGEDNSDGGGGGGGGGGFGGAGGDGAEAANGKNGGNGGNGGQSVVSPGFRGGCPGANGGDGQSNLGGSAGNGGGAVYLLARKTLIVSGAVTAGGQGGAGAQGDRSGGAGGGSGGMIGIEAETIQLNSGAVIAANGGGGGGGADEDPADSGNPGRATTTAALGGAGDNSPAGDGGRGAAAALVNGGIGATNSNSGGGGGGGGGGVGVVFEVSDSFQAPGALISPALTQ